MAPELHVDTYPDATVYFQVRSATGMIWNTVGAALEDYATANIAGYDIAGTEQGTSSGYYLGTMPAVAAGAYHIVVKVRLGASPAESDPTVDMFDVEWTGSALIGVSSVKTKTDSLTFTVSGQVDSNVQYVNDVAVTGTGAVGDEWGP